MSTSATTTRKRQMTICRRGFARKQSCYVYFPEIHLRGKWLEESGFKSGQVIDITCEDQRLVITIAREQRFEHI